MNKLVLVRHGQSIWNMENKFTGWTDVELSEKGIDEAHEAGVLLREKGFAFDKAYTSVLKRAIDTLSIILKELDEEDIEVVKNYKLNERHYGALQGLNKQDTADKYGEEQVHIWRRSYDVKPPLLSEEDPRYPINDPLYKNIKKELIPLSESLKDASLRTVSYYKEVIEPDIIKGKRIIISAHGNSLRGLIKYLDNISDEDIMKVEIPTGVPLVYELDDNLNVIKRYYLK